jgi:hypothetical protein
MSRHKPRRLTENFVKALASSETAYVVRDTKVTGLMIAVNKHSKSHKVQRDLCQPFAF